MTYVDAQILARRARCAEPGCGRGSPVIRMEKDGYHVVGYRVECPVSAGHPLAVTKSLFRSFLDRWRQGERLFGLDGLMFSNTLRVSDRDYEEDGTGAVIRIGREWWPGYEKKEEEMTSQALVQYTPQQLSQIRNELAVGQLTDQEFNLFLAVCRRTGLDPFARQIYAIKYGGKNPRMAIITGIDGFRLTAQRTGEYAGSDDPVFGATLIAGKYPESCTVTVYRIVQGQRVPFSHTVYWEEFSKRDGQIKDMYQAMPHQMMAVRAESHAIRKGFVLETMDLQFSEAPVPVAVNATTGEIIEGSYSQAPAQGQAHPYLTMCPIHDEEFYKRGKMPDYAHQYEGTWCNRGTALGQVIKRLREQQAITTEQFQEIAKERWDVLPSKLKPEQQCEAIEYLQLLNAGKEQRETEPIEDAEAAEEPAEAQEALPF